MPSGGSAGSTRCSSARLRRTFAALGCGLAPAVPDERAPARRRAGQRGGQAGQQRPADVKAEQRPVLPEVRQEEAELAHGVERDVVVERTAGGDVEAAVASLAERHPRSPHGAGGDRRRRRRARDGAAHPALWEVEAERPRQPRGPGASRAHHRRCADLAVLGDDAGDGARARGHGLDRAIQVERGAVSDGGARERVGRLLGIGVPVAGRVHTADPAAGQAGDHRVEVPGPEQASVEAELACQRQPRLEARQSRTRRRRARDCRPAPTRCRRPARARDPARAGWPRRRAASRADRAPAGGRSPSSSATARRAPAPAPPRRRARPGGRGSTRWRSRRCRLRRRRRPRHAPWPRRIVGQRPRGVKSSPTNSRSTRRRRDASRRAPPSARGSHDRRTGCRSRPPGP